MVSAFAFRLANARGATGFRSEDLRVLTRWPRPRLDAGQVLRCHSAGPPFATAMLNGPIARSTADAASNISAS